MPYNESIDHHGKPRSGLALGGIGAGSLELRKDGIFTNWTIFNNQPLFTGPAPQVADDSRLFFLVRWQEEGRHPAVKLLQITTGDHPAGCQLQFYTFRWMSGVQAIKYTASYPFARLEFTDRDMPFTLALEAFHPFIPHDVKNSSLPGVYFNFTVEAKTERPVQVLLMACLRHLPGYDQPDRLYAGRLRQLAEGVAVEHFCTGEGAALESETWGEMALASLHPETTWHLGWSHRHTFYEPLLHADRLPNLDTIDGQNATDKATGRRRATHPCTSTLGRYLLLDQTTRRVRHSFVLGWHFPNSYSGQTSKQAAQGQPLVKHREGHYYGRHFANAGAVLDYLCAEQASLTERTRAFHQRFYDSSLPVWLLDQVNSHLNTLSTSARLSAEGHFGIQEGLTPEQSWGPLATIDVSMYGSILTASLFPELDRASWRLHQQMQFPSGDVQHGLAGGFQAGDAAHEGVKSRLDLAPQFVIQGLRGAFLTNDRAWLEEFWPAARKALEYTLTQRDRDGDGLPEMEGSNSSYDNFPMFGPAAYVSSQWIAALLYGAEAARQLGLTGEVQRYTEAAARARHRFEEKLWNGRYFSLFNDEGGAHGGKDEGCLTDQLIGQWASRWADLPPIVAAEKLRAGLRFVFERNFLPGDGLFNCRWPEDTWLHPVPASCWFDQSNTFWTGTELGFAALLAYEGMVEEALAIVKAVDDRHRNAGRYFDHQEWGGHYYRPLAAWSLIHAFAGYAARGDTTVFRPHWPAPKYRLFFAHGTGCGHFAAQKKENRQTVEIAIHDGVWRVRHLRLGMTGPESAQLQVTLNGKRLPTPAYALNVTNGELALDFTEEQALPAGSKLRLRWTT